MSLVMLAAALLLTSCVFSPVEGDVFVPIRETESQTETETEVETEPVEEETDESLTDVLPTESEELTDNTSRSYFDVRAAELYLPSYRRGPLGSRKPRPQLENPTTPESETAEATTKPTASETKKETTAATTRPIYNSNISSGTPNLLRVFYDIQTVVAYHQDANGNLRQLASFAASTGAGGADAYLIGLGSVSRIGSCLLYTSRCV